MVYRVLCVRDNKRREREAQEQDGSGLEGEGALSYIGGGAESMDLTDKQDRAFRYSW
jgi:hypothetical protein